MDSSHSRKKACQEGWGHNDLARQAGLAAGGISIVMTRRQNPGMARALNVPPEVHCVRHDCVRELIELGREVRPDVPWPGLG